MKFPEKILLKLSEGTLARIDAVSGNRSEFIRNAVDVALSGVKISGPQAEKLIADSLRENADLVTGIGNSEVGKNSGSEKLDPPKKNSTAGALKKKADQAALDLRAAEIARRSEADERHLLDFLRCGVRTEREIAKATGWAEMRVSKVVARLGAAGRVKFRGGGIEVVE